jgi:hypothetical protein
MTWVEIGFAVAVVLAQASGATRGENSQAVRPTVLVGDDLLRVFQEGKDAAEQVDPPEIGLGTSFDPQPPPSAPPDYR